MIEIRETTKRDLALVKILWADGDVMRFVGFPEGLHQTDEYMMHWLNGSFLQDPRPTTIPSFRMRYTAEKRFSALTAFIRAHRSISSCFGLQEERALPRPRCRLR